MKANELRVGNLVTTGGVEQYVMSIDIDDPTEHRINDCQEIAYQPIPLTEDWLVKFGFELGNDEWYDLVIPNGLFLSVEQYTFNVVIGQGVQFSHALTKLKSVHQLQNLYFALTGEDLTITK